MKAETLLLYRMALRFRKFAQATTTAPATTAPTVVNAPEPQHQDARTLPGAKPDLFGAQSWVFVNQLVNVLNDGLYDLAGTRKLGNQAVNFSTVIKNPSGETSFVGAMKSLFAISLLLWEKLSVNRTVPYSVDDALEIIKELSDKINAVSFPEPNAQIIKPKLITILTNWEAILK